MIVREYRVDAQNAAILPQFSDHGRMQEQPAISYLKQLGAVPITNFSAVEEANGRPGDEERANLWMIGASRLPGSTPPRFFEVCDEMACPWGLRGLGVKNTLLFSNLEENPFNDHGSVLALYFTDGPTQEDVVKAVRDLLGKHNLGVPKSELPEWERVSTPVSERAKLTRVLVFNIG